MSALSRIKIPLWLYVTAGSALALVIGVWLIWPQFYHSLYSWMTDARGVFILGLLILIGGVVFWILGPDKRPERVGYYSYEKAKSTHIGGAGIVLGGLLLAVVGTFFANYTSLTAYNGANVTQQGADELSFEDRVPFDVANAVSARSLGDTTGDSTGDVKVSPQTGEYSVSVVRRGLFQGYESVQVMDLDTFGSPTNEDVRFCQYNRDEAGLRLGGFLPGNSLDRKIAQNVPLSVTWTRSDAVATCDGDTPMLYVPLKERKGFLFGAHHVPGGVAVYNGETGNLTIHEDMDEAPVPVYPISIAERQLDSERTNSGPIDYLFGRAGYETTNKGEDPNENNPTNFGLLTTDGQPVAVTPVTPRGSSSSVVGISSVNSDSVTSGELNEFVIHRYENPRPATSTVESDIVSSVLSGYRASGLTVFEVVPNEDGTWVASVGRTQSILYRVEVRADGSMTLIDAASGEEEESEAGEDVLDGRSLAELSNEELRELGDAVLEELANRADSE